MAYQEIGGTRQYYKYAECSDGQVLVSNARYVRSFEGNYGIQYEFMAGDGKIIVLNSTTDLDNKMIYLKEGIEGVTVKFKGRAIIEKGPYKGKKFNQIEVGVDKPDGPEQSKTQTNPPEENFL